jgi:hypothetical protein
MIILSCEIFNIEKLTAILFRGGEFLKNKKFFLMIF